MRMRAAAAAAAVLSLGVPGAPARAAEGDVTVRRLEGDSVSGAFQGVSEAGVLLSGRDPLPLDDVVEVRFPARKPAPAPAPAAAGAGPALRVHLRGGDVVVGRHAAGDSEGIRVRPADLPELRLPFDAILRVEADLASEDPCAEPASGRPPREGSDVVHLRSGDVFAGALVAAGAEGVVLETGRDRRQTVAWADVAVVHLDEDPLPAPAERIGEVETAGGSVLLATSVAGDGKTLKVSSRSGPAVDVPVASLASLRWSGGAFVYASDLAWTSTYEPYHQDGSLLPAFLRGGVRANRRPSRSPGSGCPIRLAGTTYRHGFGVLSKTAVSIPLAKQYRRLSVLFGIDDEADDPPGTKGGDVTARILGDGKELWSSRGSVRGGEPPRTIGPLPVEGVETLVLEVGYGEGFHGLDRASWADPILVRAR